MKSTQHFVDRCTVCDTLFNERQVTEKEFDEKFLLPDGTYFSEGEKEFLRFNGVCPNCETPQ